MAEKIFVNGIVSKEVAPTAPDFILGKLSIQVDDLKRWLEANDNLCDENGWINLTVMRSRGTGKRYIEVDTWKPVAKSAEATAPVATSSFDPTKGEVKTDDIPF